MANEIMKAEAETAPIHWNAEQVEVIKKTVAKDATDDELRMFLHLSQTYGLDPFAKELWFLKMDRSAPTIMTSRDGYLKIANRDPHFDGMEADVVYSQDSFRKTNGGIEHVYGAKDRGVPIGAYCLVYRNDRKVPTYVYAPFKDYNKGSSIWNKYPHAMILKVAEAQALKRAFSISGLVTREELGEEGITERPRPRNGGAAGASSASNLEERKRRVWDLFLKAHDGDADAAKECVLRVTEGLGSAHWTEEDLNRLERAYKELFEAAGQTEQEADNGDQDVDVEFKEADLI